MVTQLKPMIMRSVTALTIAGCLVVAGCAGGETSGDRPRVTASGKGCQDLRREINRLDARGVPGLIEAEKAGKKLSAARRADVDLYNRLLGEYLGNRCHL